jgi:hypothetical protein
MLYKGCDRKGWVTKSLVVSLEELGAKTNWWAVKPRVYFQNNFSNSLPVVGKRIIWCKFWGNFGCLPGFGNVITFASLQGFGKWDIWRQWLSKRVICTSVIFLEDAGDVPFGIPWSLVTNTWQYVFFTQEYVYRMFIKCQQFAYTILHSEFNLETVSKKRGISSQLLCYMEPYFILSKELNTFSVLKCQKCQEMAVAYLYSFPW